MTAQDSAVILHGKNSREDGTMGFLDNLLGGNGGQAASVMGVASDLFDKVGGVQGLVQVLQQHGLGDQVQSWVGTGSNQPVSGSALGDTLDKAGLGSVVQEAAGKLGVDPNTLLGHLSDLLPAAVDHLTPNGQVPESTSSSGGLDLGALAGLASKFLSR
ncbi:YidB family protein [Frateuria aurantia]